MSRKTCRNGLVWQARLAAAEQGRRARLVWQGRRARFVFVAAIGLGLMVTSARGGSLDAPAGPNSPASAMWTLNDIYDVLDTHTTNVTKRTSFMEPTGGPTSGTMHTLNDIMTLAKRAPVPKTGQTNTYWVSDDGTNQIGVAWPTPRFTVIGASGTVETNQIRDNLTGLIWARNANLASNTTWATGWSSVKGTCSWYQAFDVITNSAGPVNGTAKYGGTNDWRLPNICEILSLFDYGSSSGPCVPAGHPFTGVQSSAYWSSTTYGGNTVNAWRLNLAYGNNVIDAPRTTTYYVWPVRGGQ